MSAAQWSQSPHLAALVAAPQRYELLQAVRLLNYGIGENKLPIHIRYRASLSLAFPLAEIESMQPHAQPAMSEPTALPTYSVDLYPTIIGLTGPLAALPSLYTDYLASRVKHMRDEAAPAFLDMFNHRLTELYVAASWFYNLPLQYELNRNHDKYLYSLRALARQPKKINAIDSLVAYAGIIAPGRLTAEQLAHVLTRFLQVTVRVEQFVSEWFELPLEEQSALGGQQAQLGVSTFCGSRAVQFDSKIRLVFYQLSAVQYLGLSPDGDMFAVVKDFVRSWCGVVLAVELQLELDKQYIQPISLDADLETTGFGSLGRGAFLLSKTANKSHSETRYLLPLV